MNFMNVCVKEFFGVLMSGCLGFWVYWYFVGGCSMMLPAFLTGDLI